MALTGGTPQDDRRRVSDVRQEFIGLESSGLDLDDAEILRLIEVASALIERYAPGAPEAVKTEAIVRCVGYLQESPAAPVRSEKTGDIVTGYHRDSLSALRHSGAMAILSPWKIRRAGAI